MTLDTRSASPADTAHRDEVTEFLVRELPSGAEELLSEYRERSRRRPAIYLSHPITTGPRFLQWRKQVAAHRVTDDRAHEQQLKDDVIAENIRYARPLKARIEDAFSEREVIDPTEVEVPHWKQWDYHRVWAEVLERFVDTVVLADGWQYSTGCAVEYAVVLDLGLEALDARLEPLSPSRASELLTAAAAELEEAGLPNSITLAVARRARERSQTVYKDEKLAQLAQSQNVASFVSFSPDAPRLRYQVTPSAKQCARVAEPEEAIEFLFAAIGQGTVNVRTFLAEPAKGLPFFYGIESVAEAAELVRKCAADGYFTIVNETVDVRDGGVSGVTLGGIAEFAPDDTPRAVERPGTARLPRELANRILSTVYGVQIELPGDDGQRVEFSVHPSRVGFRRGHLLIWEVEEVASVRLEANVHWPNRFSRLLGDKTFGLLVAHSLGAPVPRTKVVSRRIAPFEFGLPTGTGDWWLRTAPSVQEPGHFTTMNHWVDPYELLAQEDPDRHVAAVLAQEGVEAEFSGATLATRGGGNVIEGVLGHGDEFMLGAQRPQEIPRRVQAMVVNTLEPLRSQLGPVRIEWATDSLQAWVLQLHLMPEELGPDVLSPGVAQEWIEYDPLSGLDALVELIGKARDAQAGILVTRQVGVTSHVGDLLRKAGVAGRVSIPDKDGKSIQNAP